MTETWHEICARFYLLSGFVFGLLADLSIKMTSSCNEASRKCSLMATPHIRAMGITLHNPSKDPPADP